jgi:hypothetical protein
LSGFAAVVRSRTNVYSLPRLSVAYFYAPTSKLFENPHRVGQSFGNAVFLLNDVVQVFGLAQLNIEGGIVIEAAD